MPNNMNHRILLVGSGPMAQEYAKVLMSLGVCFDVIGRGNDSANRFKENTGISVITGGLVDAYEKLPDKPTHAIIATNVEYLAEHTLFLLSKGINNILVEKPAGLYLEEIEKVADFAKLKQAKVYVAYNRRFYSSVIETQKFIEKDGGVLSFHFEFTEWSHIVEKLNRPKEVLQQWLLANSTHVIDLAFYLGGEPKEICSFISGGTDWHPSASIFSGAGTTVNGALFSYHANWEAQEDGVLKF